MTGADTKLLAGSARPPREGGNIEEPVYSFERGSFTGAGMYSGWKNFPPSPLKLGRSQRLSPSAVTLEHLAARCQSPDERFLFAFLESDSLHLVY